MADEPQQRSGTHRQRSASPSDRGAIAAMALRPRRHRQRCSRSLSWRRCSPMRKVPVDRRLALVRAGPGRSAARAQPRQACWFRRAAPAMPARSPTRSTAWRTSTRASSTRRSPRRSTLEAGQVCGDRTAQLGRQLGKTRHDDGRGRPGDHRRPGRPRRRPARRWQRPHPPARCCAANWRAPAKRVARRTEGEVGRNGSTR